ncbi:hypothetical protein VNO78_25548 [Psophocarpus tetragonolobus]|uniref:Non-specific lipid-transfer protein n=1 Tax=Psophocarpus tetragonolobus TaxID=3891 RepID=A0AAN9S9S5_PSOTE
MASVKVACVVAVLCMVVVSAHAITCNQVSSAVAPCLPYLRSGGKPSGLCCQGVAKLNSQAKTTADHRTACNCLKTLAKGVGSSLNPNNAASLPAKCNVNIPYKISLSTNCNSIQF